MKFKISILVALALALVIFALQNTEFVVIKLWFWEIQTPRALLILICITIGILIGFLIPSIKRNKDIDSPIE